VVHMWNIIINLIECYKRKIAEDLVVAAVQLQVDASVLYPGVAPNDSPLGPKIKEHLDAAKQLMGIDID